MSAYTPGEVLTPSEAFQREIEQQENLARALAKVEARQRRERIATAVLSGMCACPQRSGPFADFASDAVAFTDALIAELDKEDSNVS